MGLLDDYLNSSSSDTPAKEVKPSSGGLLEQYLNSPSSEAKPKSSAPIRPPISGVSSEASDEINAQPVKAGGANPRDQVLIEGIKNLPNNVGNSIVEDAKSGLSTVAEGVNDTFSGKPATGVGKVGLGALSTLVSPLTGTSKEVINKPITELTGNKQAGDIVELALTGGLPITKATKATIAAIPKNKALKTLVESIGPENAGEVAKRMRENPRLTPADLSPKVLQDTQHLFANDGPQINYLKNASDARMAGRKNAIIDAYDASAGTPVNVVTKLNELATNSKAVGSKKINPAIESAGPVDLTNTINSIDKILKPGAMNVVTGESSIPLTGVKKELANIKQYLGNDKEIRTNAKDLHDFQAGLRRTAEGMLKSPNGGDRQLGEALMNVRNNIVRDIDKAAGGKYKPALSEYRDEMHIADAFRDGYSNVFSNSKKMENRPEFTKDWFDKLTDAEKEAVREGARTAIGTEIGVARNGALSGESLARSDFNKEKLEILFGKDEAKKLIQSLEDERRIADTHNKVVEGSQTAMRMASKDQFKLPEKTDGLKSLIGPAAAEALNLGSMYLSGGSIPGAGIAAYGAMKGATSVKDAIALKLAKEHQMRYAKYAMPTEAGARQELIQALEAVAAQPPKQSIVRRAANTGIRLGSLVAP